MTEIRATSLNLSEVKMTVAIDVCFLNAHIKMIIKKVKTNTC